MLGSNFSQFTNVICPPGLLYVKIWRTVREKLDFFRASHQFSYILIMILCWAIPLVSLNREFLTVSF